MRLKSFNRLSALSIHQRSFVEALAEVGPLFVVAAVGNDWFGSTLPQFIAQFVTVVRLVTDQAFGWFNLRSCDAVMAILRRRDQTDNRKHVPHLGWFAPQAAPIAHSVQL